MPLDPLPFVFPPAPLPPAVQEAPTQEGQASPPAGSEGPPPPSGGLFGGSMLFPLLAVFAIFYFVMIGPERKQRRKREAMLKAVKKGDKVMTTGGMYATVAAVQDDVVTLQIADGVRARFSMQSLQAVIEDAPPEAKDAK